MRKISTNKPVAAATAKPVSVAKPRAIKAGSKPATVSAATVAANVAVAKAGTNSNVTPKPAPSVATIAAPLATALANVDAAVARVPAGVNRTARTIEAMRVNFGGVTSERDTAYLSFYGSLARPNGHTVTVTDIAQSGRRPAYSGSNKPHDAGVIERLSKAGLCTIHDNGHRIVFTDKAKALAAYKA